MQGWDLRHDLLTDWYRYWIKLFNCVLWKKSITINQGRNNDIRDRVNLKVPPRRDIIVQVTFEAWITNAFITSIKKSSIINIDIEFRVICNKWGLRISHGHLRTSIGSRLISILSVGEKDIIVQSWCNIYTYRSNCYIITLMDWNCVKTNVLSISLHYHQSDKTYARSNYRSIKGKGDVLPLIPYIVVSNWRIKCDNLKCSTWGQYQWGQ